jgi:predicted amidohydrolase
MRRFEAAVVQLSSGSDEDANWDAAREQVERAAAAGAELVATPENTNYLGPHDEKVRRAEPLDGPTATRFADLARRLGIHLLLGSFNETSDDPGRCHNTSVLFGPAGERLAIYRKRHLFDVDLSDDVRFVESDTVKAGDEIVVADSPLGRIGLAICYDLRFPEHAAALARGGADLLAFPSAFTAPTGAAHWDVLTRARAIETQCWLLAPAQWGRHDDGGLRESWGRSRIVDPWGTVVAEVAEGPGFARATIDPERTAGIRAAMPVARHRRS